MENFLKDIRFAVRNLRMHPAFSLVAVLTIALGIGSVTAIFSVVSGVLLRDLPFEEPAELVRVWSTNAERGVARGFMSPPDIEDYAAQNRTLMDLAAYSEAELVLIDDDGSAVKVTGTWAGANLFAVLGVEPVLGRGFLPDDGAPDAPKVMVASHGFWQARLGGTPDALGTTLIVDEVRYTVVGVMPAGFDFPGRSSFWLNRHLMAYPGRYARWMEVVGRLRPDAELEAAQADFSAIAVRLEEEYPQWNRAYRTLLLPLHEATVGDTRSTLLILLGATGILLLIACVNVTSLVLSRMAERGREIAVRSAMGAGRLRLSRQMLTEALVLSAVGAVLGTVIAAFGIDVLVALAPQDLPRMDEVSIDGSVLLFALGSMLATGLVFGLAPVFRLARTDIKSALQDGGRGSTAGFGRERLRSLLVTTEIALAVMLVIGAGLLSRSYSRLLATDPGFDATGILTLQLDLPTRSYRDFERVADYYTSMTDRLAEVGGVEAVAATAALPFDSEVPFLGNFLVQGRDAPEEGEEPKAHYRQVTAGFFGVMGIDLIGGREFGAGDDRTGLGVAVVSETLARMHFPDEDPIGKTIVGLPPHLALGGFLVDEFEIVGVVEDVKYFGLDEASEPSLYFPVAQAPFRRMNFTLRTARDLPGLMREVRREVASVDPTVPISRVETMERILSASVAQDRFAMLLLMLFGGTALLLATVGVYGVISYTIAQRTAELGIRVAVGASPPDVLKLVMMQGATLTVAGIGAGLVGAALLSRVMASQLYGISAMDAPTFAGAALVLGLVAMTATFIPAARAARLDPVLALHGEGP